MELLHNLQHCSHTLMYTIHTCCSCKWYFLSSIICAFSSTVFCWRKTSSCWRFSASLGMANFCWRRVSEVWSKKIKTQHNLATLRSQMCMGAKPPHPRIPLLQTEILNKDTGIQIEWKCWQCWCPRRLIWMSETWTLLVKATSISSFHCTSTQCSWQAMTEVRTSC